MICDTCSLPIEEGIVFMKALGKVYHKECFRCADCNVELGSSTFREHKGRPYHVECCPTTQRCKSCDVVLVGTKVTKLIFYTTPYWKETLCAGCYKSQPSCDCCKRTIPRTDSYIKRHNIVTCEACESTVVDDSIMIKKAYQKVTSFFKDKLLIPVDSNQLAITLVPRFESPDRVGQATRSGGTYEIEIREGFSFLRFCYILAHEVRHVMFWKEGNRPESVEEEEGQCELASFLFLFDEIKEAPLEVAVWLKLLISNPIDVYRNGLLKAIGKIRK